MPFIQFFIIIIVQKLLPNGIIISGWGSAPTGYKAAELNKKDIIAGFIDPDWENKYLKDGVFVHEIFSSTEPVSLRALSDAVNRFNDTLNFNASHAVVITYNTIASNGLYQLNIVSNIMDTYVVMNFASIQSLESVGIHGVSNPKCQYHQLKYITSPEFMTSFLVGSNNGVTGQYVYPITDRQCLGKLFNFVYVYFRRFKFEL